MISGIQRYSAMDRVVFGASAPQALAEQVEALGRSRALIVSIPSLVEQTDFVDRARSALGDRAVGVFSDIAAHSPRECVIAGAEAARAANADILIAIGGGSAIDACKVMLMALWHNIDTTDALGGLMSNEWIDPSSQRSGDVIRMIAVPTTLSAAEFTWYGGVTDSTTKMKEVYTHPLIVPQVVILDPEMTTATPDDLFLSTGIKALDHALERICAPNANPISDAQSLHAARMLAEALPRAKANPDDPSARFNCQMAMWLSIGGSGSQVSVGASHGIGHVLGAHLGVMHGHTSCIMLPAVLEWNLPETRARQDLISEAMGRAGVPASTVVRDLVSRLGQPTRLSQLGVGAEDLPVIAEKAMHDRTLARNPRPIHGPEDVLEILKIAA